MALSSVWSCATSVQRPVRRLQCGNHAPDQLLINGILGSLPTFREEDFSGLGHVMAPSADTYSVPLASFTHVDQPLFGGKLLHDRQ
jgi:hypothetical protein